MTDEPADTHAVIVPRTDATSREILRWLADTVPGVPEVVGATMHLHIGSLIGYLFTPQPEWDGRHPVAWLAAGGDAAAVIAWILDEIPAPVRDDDDDEPDEPSDLRTDLEELDRVLAKGEEPGHVWPEGAGYNIVDFAAGTRAVIWTKPDGEVEDTWFGPIDKGPRTGEAT
jgi:hypothetical protein